MQTVPRVFPATPPGSPRPAPEFGGVASVQGLRPPARLHLFAPATSIEWGNAIMNALCPTRVDAAAIHIGNVGVPARERVHGGAFWCGIRRFARLRSRFGNEEGPLSVLFQRLLEWPAQWGTIASTKPQVRGLLKNGSSACTRTVAKKVLKVGLPRFRCAEILQIGTASTRVRAHRCPCRRNKRHFAVRTPPLYMEKPRLRARTERRRGFLRAMGSPV